MALSDAESAILSWDLNEAILNRVIENRAIPCSQWCTPPLENRAVIRKSVPLGMEVLPRSNIPWMGPWNDHLKQEWPDERQPGWLCCGAPNTSCTSYRRSAEQSFRRKTQTLRMKFLKVSPVFAPKLLMLSFVWADRKVFHSHLIFQISKQI